MWIIILTDPTKSETIFPAQLYFSAFCSAIWKTADNTSLVLTSATEDAAVAAAAAAAAGRVFQHCQTQPCAQLHVTHNRFATPLLRNYRTTVSSLVAALNLALGAKRVDEDVSSYFAAEDPGSWLKVIIMFLEWLLFRDSPLGDSDLFLFLLRWLQKHTHAHTLSQCGTFIFHRFLWVAAFSWLS